MNYLRERILGRYSLECLATEAEACGDPIWFTAGLSPKDVWSLVLPSVTVAFLMHNVLSPEARGPFLAVFVFDLIYEALFVRGYMRFIAFLGAAAICTALIWIITFVGGYRSAQYDELQAKKLAFKQSNNVYTAKDTAELDRLLAANNHAIVFFYGEWCPFSQSIASAYGWLADEYSCPGYFAVIQVEVTWTPELHQRYQVTEIPTFIAFEAGQPAPVQVPNAKPDARVQRVGANGIERIFGSLELHTLMSVIKVMSDIAWGVAHDVAQQKAQAANFRSAYKNINNVCRFKWHKPSVPLQLEDRGPINLTPQPREVPARTPEPLVHATRLARIQADDAKFALDPAYYSEEDSFLGRK